MQGRLIVMLPTSQANGSISFTIKALGDPMKRFVSFLFVGALLATAPLFAAAPVFSNQFVSVTLDGVRLGTDTDPSNYSMFPSVVYDSSSGLFHMWVANTTALTIEGLRHATSSDGIHFVSDGNVSFSGGNPFPAYGAATEPQFEFPRAAKIGDDWKLLIWTENAPVAGQYGDYNYNESVNDIGIDPSTLAVTHQGPIYPTNGLGTFGQTTGPYGIVNGRLYVADDRIGGLSKWEYVDAAPPSVTPPADTFQDLITGTGYVYFLTHPGDPLGVYVHNVARLLDQGDGTLGVYYALRHPDGSRVNKQIYYAQSGDGGQTWSTPVGLFSNGDAVRVDGAPNQFDFSHPEVTLVGSRRVLYFSTKAADGAFVVATSAGQPAQAGSWADLLGSTVGSGESGVGVARTPDGGYAVLARALGFTTSPAFWLLKLDGDGEVVWQKLYTRPGAGEQFFPTALAAAPNGDLALAGYFEDATNSLWIVKVDQSGTVAWSKNYLTCDTGSCGNRVRALAPTSDGGFAFTGSVAGATGTFGIGKVDGDGVLQWIHAYPAGAMPSDPAALVETADGGLAAGGALALIPPLKYNDRVLRTDSAGAVQWDRQIVSSGSQVLSGIANADAGGLVVAGSSDSPYAQAVALDADGNIVWQRDYTGFYLGVPSGIAATAAGGFAMSGSSGSGRGTILEIDGSGTTLWAKAFGAHVEDSVQFVALGSTFDGGFIATGPNFVDANSRVLVVKVGEGGQFVGCLGVETSFPITETVPSLSVAAVSSTVVDETANTAVADVAASEVDTDAAERTVCSGTLPQTLEAAGLAVDPSGNGVAEPGETFVVEPSWTNLAEAATTLSGQTSASSDSNGLDTSAPDPAADYGTVASLATADCGTATGDCYQLQLQSPRPPQHWDTYADETLTISDPHHQFAKRWTIHIGLSFDDVSPSSGFYPFIEDIFHNGITGGCGAGIYCPTNSVTRAQMSVFLLKSKHGASFVPPPCQGIFGDVACPSLFADWIEELAAEGITAGCSTNPLLYCPDSPVTRQQMSAFLLKALKGSGYVPPPASGIFGDVPVSNPFAPWIEDLYNRQITAGCSASPLLYCPADPNTRQQMAVFLTKTFSLVLYGP